METQLILRVYLLDDRYHGEGDWPPAPARVFQALVAGNAIGGRLEEEHIAALRWLEADVGAPRIRAQAGRPGLGYKTFVPNNDLDAVGGDPGRIGEIRVVKHIRPRHVDARQPILYSWRFHAEATALNHARTIAAMAENLYQLGRGVDMAFASAALLADAEGEATLAAASGDWFEPGTGGGGVTMSCPQLGSVASLQQRFAAQCQRFSHVRQGRKVNVYFTNPPKARFQQVTYNPTAPWRLYELRADSDAARFRAWPLAGAVELVECVRDRAAERLAAALPEQADLIGRILVGRDATAGDKARRVQMIPIPSIGHEHTNRSIRRLLVRAAPDCPISFGDLDWAFSGLFIEGRDSRRARLAPADDLGMLRHYGIETGDAGRRWRSVTPLALPREAARRRIEPKRQQDEAKSGDERASEESHAIHAVLAALRHAGRAARVESVRVQREPFSRNGVRAETFADSTRFVKERLWHVELCFRDPVEGPLILGDGRYLGLGVMAPWREDNPGLMAFHIQDGLLDPSNPERLAQALRRAVMARVQQRIGPKRSLPALVSGHARDGSPLREDHRHLAFVPDLARSRLLIVPPYRLGHRPLFQREREDLQLLDAALTDFDQLSAGPAGLLKLGSLPAPSTADPFLTKARIWQSVTDYRPTRHPKQQPVGDAVIADARAQLARLGLPTPDIDLLTVIEGPKGGVRARLRLTFPVMVQGPLLLGRTRHLGGGVFEARALASDG